MRLRILKANWLIIAVFLAAVQLPLCGQEARGTLLGRVSDPSGAVIVGAKVEGLNTATGVRANATTNQSGDYLFPYLIPGSYTITVEAAGFKRFVRSAINLRMDDRITVDAAMQLGQAAESVEVVGTATLLDTSTASMGQVMETKTILELPLQNGNLYWSAALSPGVVDTNTGAGYVRPIDTGHPSAISVDGTTSGSNQYNIDGAPNMQGNVMAYSPPPGIVEEFKVVGSSFDASYGYMSGAAINLSLKSGTNKLHGQGYYFNQNPKLGANTFFGNRSGAGMIPFRLHRWGATASGPIYLPKVYDGRNKLFWMYGYEGLKSFDPTPYGVEAVPTAAERTGNFAALLALGSQYQIYDPFSTTAAAGGLFSRKPLTGNIIPPSQINPVAANIAKLYDLPNLAGTADGLSNYTQGLNSRDIYYNHIGRVDFNLSQSQRLYMRAYRTNNPRPQQYRHHGAEGWTVTRSNVGGAADYVFTISPAFFIEARYSYTRFVTQYTPSDMGFDLAGLGFSSTFINQINQVNPLGIRMPVISPSGYAALAGQYNLQAAPYDTHDFVWNGSRIVGAHTLRFGVGYRVLREDYGSLGQSSGSFSFGSSYTNGPNNTSSSAPVGQGFASFLYGLPTSGSFPIPSNYAEQTTTSAFYIQDDWKLSTKLTLSAGLRYEVPGALTERFDRSVLGFDFAASSPIEAQAKANYAASPIPEIPAAQFQVKGGLTFAGVNGASHLLWNTPKRNLMPRVGAAYSVTPKLVLRGGFGIFYEPIGVVSTNVTQTGFSRSTSMTPTVDNGVHFIANLTNPFPDGFLRPLGAAGGLSTNLGSSVSFFNQSIKNPYTQRWQLAVQRALPGTAVLEVSYVGNRGVRQRTSRNYDALPNRYLSTSPARDQTTINYLAAVFPNPFYPLLPGTSLSGTNVARTQLLIAYPQFTGVSRDENQGRSWYHSMQVRFEKRFATGLSTTLSYTWSKLMDGSGFKNSADPMPEEVISSSDRSRRLTMTWIYALPFGRGHRWVSSTPVLSTLIGGWQLQGVYTQQSGPPLGFGDAILTGDLKSIPLSSDQRSISQWFNVNPFDRKSADALSSHLRVISTRFAGIRGDGVRQFDLSVLKNTRLREGLNLDFRAEAYNALNTPQFNPPNTTPTSSAFGTVTGEFSKPRTVQLALKLLF